MRGDLPPGTLQIIAVCTGYVSANTNNKGQSNIREGQVIERVDGIVTVPMEQSAQRWNYCNSEAV